MRYKIVIYPMIDQTLCIISTAYDGQFKSGTVYERTYTLKTKGVDWDLPGFLRETADQLDADQF